MVREIVTDIDFLEKPLEKVESVEEVKELARDLLDTARHHVKRCLGLSANQIGGTKKVVAVKITENDFILMINPTIVKKSTQCYVATEECLSLEGARKTMRNRWVDVMYRDSGYHIKKMHCTGLVGQIVQHGIDHTNGVII